MFFKLVILLALGLAVWITQRLTALSKLKWPVKSMILFGVMSVLCLPVIVRDRGPFTGIAYDITYYTLYFAFICLILFAILLIIRDSLWLTVTGIAKCCKKPAGTLPYTRETLVRANIWTFAIAFFLALAALHEGVKVPAVRTLTITTPKVTESVDMVVLSDLHLYRSLLTHKLRGIVERTNAIHPDIIVLPGDTIDDRPNQIQPQLRALSELKAKHGLFATDGNHEFYVGRAQAGAALEETGITRLTNTGVSLPNGVFIAGIPDHRTVRQFGGQADLNAALAGSTPDMYRVLLSHRPDIAPQAAKAGLDLQVSGHTHGGQIFPFQMIAKWFNGYLQGRYTVGDMMLYVSAGAGQWGPQMRLFAPAEIVHIRLVPEQTTPPVRKKKKADLPVFVPTPIQADPSYFPPVFHQLKEKK